MRIMRSLCTYLAMCLVVIFVATGTAISGTPDTIEKVPVLAPLSPTGVATDSLGNIYVADTGNHKVIMASSTGATILTIGTGVAGFAPSTGSTGLNTTLADVTIQLNSPAGVAVDVSGNLYIADTGNHRIHMVVADITTKVITGTSKIITIAGSGIAGFSGDNGSATVASLNRPTGIAVDSTGNAYVADNGNYRVRKVPPVKIGATGTLTPGLITTVAGDGKASTLTAYGIALSPAPAGDLYIADSGNHRILKLAAAKGAPVVVAGTGSAGFSGDGGVATLAQLNQPSGVATDGNDLYIADTLNNCIRKLSLATGVIATRVGSVAQSAHIVPVLPVSPLSFPMGIGISASSTVYIADSANNVIDQVYSAVSAITSASPPGGSYGSTQAVTLTASKAANISYRINGGPATPYTTPITVSGPGTSTLTFTSLDFAGHQEVINTATYTFDTTPPTTTTSINGTPASNGIYYSAQSALKLTLSAGALSTIYYTTGTTATVTDPTTASSKYTSPVLIPVTLSLTTTTAKFFAVDVAGNQEVTQSVKYPIIAISSTASPAGGAYRSAQVVTLASNYSSGVIYYTTDGSEPTLASPVYNPALHVNIAASTVLKFRAKDPDGYLEQTKTQTYTIDAVAPTTTVSPVGTGVSYASPQTVTLTPDDLNATIYYSLTGIAPTTASSKYTGPIPISKTTTLMFFAMDAAGNREAVKTEVYTIDEVAPVTTASLASGTYASVQSVALTCDDPKATIYFTTNGSLPTTLSTKYTTPIPISGTTKLQFFAMDTAGNKESVKERSYSIISLSTTASPRGGVFNAPQTVELASNGIGSTIYFTTDGSAPTVTITKQYPDLTVTFADPTQKYTKPILLQNTVTKLRFFSIDSRGVIEPARSETYTLDYDAPATAVGCGGVSNTITLTATDTVDPMPRIQYIANTATNGGATPAYTISDYAAPITFSANTIVKFFATDAAGNSEPVQTAFCADVVGPIDPNPSLYLETLANGTTTSNDTVFLRGNVAPFATATLDINGSVVAVNAIDGSFSHSITTPALVAGPNVLTTTAANGIPTTTDVRTINYVTPGTTPTSITVGKSNAVIGHTVRIPITISSGHQAAALSIDLDYDPTTSGLANPGVSISKAAAALGKVIRGGIPSTGVYRILIMDDPAVTTSVALPEGIVGYLSFTVPYTSAAGTETLTITSYSATDLQSTALTVQPILPAMHGVVNIVTTPGNSIGSLAGDTAVTLKGVQDALYMLLDPINHPADGSVDLNADGIVQIYELQRVINSFLGL